MNCKSPRKALINNQETQSTTRSKYDLNQRQFNANSRNEPRRLHTTQHSKNNANDSEQPQTTANSNRPSKNMHHTMNNGKHQRTAINNNKQQPATANNHNNCGKQQTPRGHANNANNDERQRITTSNIKKPVAVCKRHKIP